MGTIIFLVIVGFVIYWLVGEAKRKLESAKNYVVGERGHCVDCKYCVYDKTHKYSETDYFCRLSKCSNITDNTIMDCREKPTVTEEDIQEILKLKLWTLDGERYIRSSLLGKKMGWTDVDAFMRKLPQEHPEYMKKQ